MRPYYFYPKQWEMIKSVTLLMDLLKLLVTELTFERKMKDIFSVILTNRDPFRQVRVSNLLCQLIIGEIYFA